LIGLCVGGGYWAHRAGLLDRRTLQQISLPGLRPPASHEVTLYFADPRWTRLVPEARQVPAAGGTVGAMGALVSALADGSREGHAPVLPQTARLLGAYLGNDGLAVLDFSPDLAQFSPGGASGEVLSVFAVVNSVAGNVPGVERVLILIDGQERETLAGHVKISEPIAPDSQWLQPPPH
jgi:spore germination protein GerM